MFSNIEKKIKTLAKVLTWIGIVASVLAGLMFIIAGLSQDAGGAGVALGVLMMVLGSLGAWISSMALYAFGQLVEDTKATRELMEDEIRR